MSECISDAVSYTKNIQNLDFEMQKLKYTRNRVQRSIDEAMRNGERIVRSVTTDWLNESQETVGKAEEIVSTAARVPCFNIKRRYFLSRKARETSSSIAQLRDRDVTIGQVFYTRPILHPVEPTSGNDELASPSRILILKHIIDSLKDPNINMIGIYGMGGTGKTTLAKNVRRRAERDKLFDVVAMAIVSPTPDLFSIQDQIAESLNLQFETRNPEVRATSLRARIMEFEKILVVLDDIWAKQHLEIIGIPHGSDHVGCKLLFTSRSAHVLYIMGTQRDFKLEALTEEEAWSLFENSVGGFLDPEVRPIGMEIARRCEGLPLAIVTVAHALRGRNSSGWRAAIDQLRKIDSDSASFASYSATPLHTVLDGDISNEDRMPSLHSQEPDAEPRMKGLDTAPSGGQGRI